MADSLSRPTAALLATAVLVTACSGSDPVPVPSPSPTTTAVPSPAPAPSPTETGPPRPLNGRPAADEEALRRRVVAVKIDNHELARPQSGLEHADAVIELIVEAGLTRFIALFHSGDAEYVGPMRSGRPTDPGLVGPLGATFAISGAQSWVLELIREAGVALIGDIGPPATFRSSARRSPHNLYTDTTVLREVADRRGYGDAPPEPWFSFAAWGEGLGEEAGDVTLDWSNATTVTWEWTGEQYARLQDGAEHALVTRDGASRRITAETLVVLTADRYTARPPGAGSAVPALDTVGSGRALVFHGGRVREGSWSRATATAPFVLADADGEILGVPPGRLWVSVHPAGRAVSW